MSRGMKAINWYIVVEWLLCILIGILLGVLYSQAY